MARTKVVLKSPGMADLLRDPGVRADLTARAERVLSAAQSARDDTGAYQASLHIVQATTDRAVVRVVADDPGAMAIEADQGILARALDAAG